MPALDADPRWRRFNDSARPCPCCGRHFAGIFDIGFDHPDAWPHGNLREHGGDEMRVGADRLGSDLCAVGPHRFVRCVMPFPIIGAGGESFAFGVWGSLNTENFAAYVDSFGGGAQSGLGPWFSWLSNALPVPYRSPPVEASLHPGDGSERPLLYVENADHPAWRDQREGISFDALLDIYAASGEDLRPHLTEA